jgi:hypothetical protein
MNWNSFFYLLVVMCIAYAPYKYIQRFGNLMQISFHNAVLASVTMSVSIFLLLTDIAQSSITLNGVVISTVGAVFLFWFAIPYIFPRLAQRPTKYISPPHNIIIASLRFPLSRKFVELFFKKSYFICHFARWQISLYERIFAFAGAYLDALR